MDHHSLNLFPAAPPDTRHELLAPGAWVLHGFALSAQTALLAAVQRIASQAPFRQLETPGGFRMSVAMTNCGERGWVSDRTGYRYAVCDPLTGKPWPEMPAEFLALASDAAEVAGFSSFAPDACLVNRYVPGARLTLHQDRDERDMGEPIVSVSLGLPAVFLFGGNARSDRQQRVPLQHGDVVVWGGPSRLRYHGVSALKDGVHEALGTQRINLTFRRAA